MLASWFKRWKEARMRAAALRELNGWSDLQLEDIGITRDRIADYVDGHLSASREDAGRSAKILCFPGPRPCCPEEPCCTAA